MKDRVAYLEIDGRRFGDIKPDSGFSGLNVGFDVHFTGSALVPSSSGFQLFNLNKNDMRYLTTNPTIFLEQPRIVKCYAGYSGNVNQIFGGQILESYPTGMPDTSVKISCFSNIANMGKHIVRNFKNPLFITLLNDAASACGYILNILSPEIENSVVMNSMYIPDFSFEGSSHEYLQLVEREILSRNQIREDMLSFTVAKDILYVYYLSKANSLQTGTKLISAETGMVGIPSLTRVGVNIQTLMDVTLLPGQTIELKSRMLPDKYKGLYNIINIRHHGILRGTEWYSDLECCKIMKGLI